MLNLSQYYRERHQPDILDCIANLSSDEVFTPPELADKILDLLPSEMWSNPDLTFLDPAAKTGIFLRQIAARLMVGLREAFPDEQQRREHIFRNQLYGIAITELTGHMSRRSVYYSKDATSKHSVVQLATPSGNIRYTPTSHTFTGGKCTYCGQAENEGIGTRQIDGTLETHAYEFIHLTPQEAAKMKFDVIVGNPPYQLKDGGASASAMPIYQKFIEQAKLLKPRYMAFIIPSRWFAGGKGLDKFRDDMLNDSRIRTIYDYPNADECFPGVLISGGVMYFVWDSQYDGLCEVHTMTDGTELPVKSRRLNEFDVFIRENQAVPILEKIRSRHEETLDKIVSARKPFGLDTKFAHFDDIDNPDKYLIYSSNQVGVRKTGYVQKTYITKGIEFVDAWKVLMPYAYRIGSSKDGGYVNPIVAAPGSVCTESFVIMKTFKSEVEARNFVSYIKTRTFRFLVSLRKISQHATAKVYAFVPDLPMNETWTDEKLYARYNIDADEQAFIESMIKEMA